MHKEKDELTTECCDVLIQPHQRYCQKCGLPIASGLVSLASAAVDSRRGPYPGRARRTAGPSGPLKTEQGAASHPLTTIEEIEVQWVLDRLDMLQADIRNNMVDVPLWRAESWAERIDELWADLKRATDMCIMDFPTAWAYIRDHHPDPAEHDPKCSWVQALGGILCDCHVINAEYERRKALAKQSERV